MNCNHPIVRNLIMDSLRYWVTEMHVDGFRFDLASILGRDRQGNVLANPPMIEMIAEDPVLRDTKIIAEAWDAAGLYQVGNFSTDPRWAEWNGRFRDDVRAFMFGSDDTVTHLATRIAGSSDLYQASGRGPSTRSISSPAMTASPSTIWSATTGKTTWPTAKTTGTAKTTISAGTAAEEGETDDPEVTRLRFRRMKTFAAILFLSQGVPMLAGRRRIRPQPAGNNNAWCQDNAISWLDWSLLATNREFFRFFQHCIALRKKHRVFRRSEFFCGNRYGRRLPAGNLLAIPLSRRTELGRVPAMVWPFSSGPKIGRQSGRFLRHAERRPRPDPALFGREPGR